MGREKAQDEIFCRTCGEPIKRKAEICPECGVRNEYVEPQGNQQQSSGRQTRQQSGTTSTQSNSSASSTTEHDPSKHTTTVSDQWHYGVGASIVLWIVGFAVPTGDGIAGIAFLVAWALMPVAFYFDTKWVRATTKWGPSHGLWIIGSLVPLLNLLVGAGYLYKRSQSPQVSPADSTGSTEDEAEAKVEELRERYSQGKLTDVEFERRLEAALDEEDVTVEEYQEAADVDRPSDQQS